MFSLILQGALIVMAIGIAAKVYLDRTENELRIDKKELAIASAALLLIALPLIAWVGVKLSVNNLISYRENWGGFEFQADWLKTECYKNGPCRWEWSCDPRRVSYDCSYTDSKGKRVHKTCYRTEYDDCPYATEEWTFQVQTTLGTFTMADRNLPTNPDSHRWRRGVRVPDHLPSGVPNLWQQASDRIRSGDPGPVTIRQDYDNYILASQRSIMKRYNDSIERYQKAKQLPAINSEIHSFYYEDRVYFVGMPAEISGDRRWQRNINRFDAALGSTLQGDLHLVIVNTNQIGDPDNYFGALMAYWQSPAMEENALSKNGILIVIGSGDGKTVQWARAGTGMPLGNEAMVVSLQSNLRGLALDPDVLLGYGKASVVGKGVTVTPPKSAIGDVVWGPDKFTRVPMKGDEKSPGFTYLLKEVEPTTGQRVGILVVMFIAGCIAWGICINSGLPMYRNRRDRHDRF